MIRCIYGLVDPTSNAIRYVGFTSKKLDRRLWEHIHESKSRNTCHRHRWIRSLIRNGSLPTIRMLETVTEENRQERERAWIVALSANNLTNSTDGGEGLINPSEDVRRRIGATVSQGLLGNSRRSGIRHSDEAKQRIGQGVLNSLRFSEGIKNRKKAVISVEGREKLRTNLGKTFSAEHRRNISNAMKLHHASDRRGR